MKSILLLLLVAFVAADSSVNINFANLLGGSGGKDCPTCPTCTGCIKCRFSVPETINIYGAKPPRYLIGNISNDYYETQQPNFRVSVNYRPVDLPETVSGDGIEVLLRGFGDIASSGRYIVASDFTSRGCNGSLVQEDGSSSGPCFGRTIMNIGFVNDHIFFAVHPSNPVNDITFDQLNTATKAILAGSSVTWSQIYPGVTFPGDMGSQKVNFLNGPPGGGIPQSVDVLTGVRTNSIPALSSAAISAARAASTNWITFGVLATPPDPKTTKAITWNGQSMYAEDYAISHTFNAIIDVNNPRAAAVKDFLCYTLNYQFDGKKFNLFPLNGQQRAMEKTKLGC